MAPTYELLRNVPIAKKDDMGNVSPDSALGKLQRIADIEAAISPTLRRVSRPSRSAKLLKQWREDDDDDDNDINTPKRIKLLANADMDRAFPAIIAPSKPKVNCFVAHQLRLIELNRSNSVPTQAQVPQSDMGLLGRLPGELRNHVFRLALVGSVIEPQADASCSTGVCKHMLVSSTAPGIASSCHQLRHEVLPIWCGENSFHFEAGLVRNRCAGNFIRSLGERNAGLIGKVTLEVLVCPVHGAAETVSREIAVECPVSRKDCKFEVTFGDQIPKPKITASGIGNVMGKINEEGRTGRGARLAWLVGSDELADLVFKCKKGAVIA